MSVANFPKIFKIIYCPDIIKQDGEYLKKAPVIMDIGNGYSLLSENIVYHKNFGLYFTSDIEKTRNQILVDHTFNICQNEYSEEAWKSTQEMDYMVEEFEKFVIANKPEVVRKLQWLNPDTYQDEIRRAYYQIERYSENYKVKAKIHVDHEPGNSSKWYEAGYSASKDTTDRERQTLLWRLYDEGPIKYSPDDFYSHTMFLERKNGRNPNAQDAIRRRRADRESLYNYAKTGERVLYRS